MTEKRSIMRQTALLVLIALLMAYPAFAGTHINVSMTESVYQNVTYARDFYGVSNQTYCFINGTLFVHNPGTETVYDIYLNLVNTNRMISNFTYFNDGTGRYGYQKNGTPGTPIIIHIPELRSGNHSTFRYNVTCNNTNPPINISTTYINTDHGNNLKVLSGQNWTINQTINNMHYLQQPVQNLNITIQAMDVQWNLSTFSFALLYLYNLNDSANVVGNGTSNTTWYWTPLGGTVDYNQSAWITYIARAPYSVPFTASYMAITETLTYQTGFLMSNLSLTQINGSAKINFSFEKRISQPSDNLLNHNVTYEIRPYVIASDNITFDLNTVTLWVTADMDPSNRSTSFGYLNKTYTGSPIQRINITEGWNPAGNYWYFNFTDGSNSSYPPPIVWMKPEWLISNANGQIVNYTATKSGLDLYMKYIYVINGYWLEIKKNITNTGEGQYDINITVENIGNGWTPEYEYVTVYDFVPNQFTAYDIVYDPSINGCWGTSWCTNLSVGSPGSEFYGTSYRWNIYWKAGMNSSLGPKFGPDATGAENYSWSASYKVNGTGAYQVTQLYVVGLDPLKVDGASASPVISVITGLESKTREIMYIAIVAFLIVVNVTNLIITNRINKKLELQQKPKKR